MAEHITRNDGVVGSIPTASSSTEIPSTARFPVKLGTVLWREFLPFTLRAGERPLSGGSAKLTARPFSMVNDRLINARSFNGPLKPYKKQPLALGQLQNEALHAFAWVIDPHIQIIAIQYKHGTALRQNNIDIIPCLPFSRKTMLNEA